MPVVGPLVTAMATPFDADGELDLDGAQELASHLVDSGTDTVLLAGTTGEAPTLNASERWQLLKAVREAVEGRASVMVGSGTNVTSTSVRGAVEATEHGADALLVVTPYYNKPSQRGLLEHFTAVAGATDRPVILYNIPGRTAREIEVDTLVELSGVDNIAGVKDAVNHVGKTAEVVARTSGAPGGFEVFCGTDEFNLPMVSVGAAGLVSVASHLAGPDLADMLRIHPTDPAKAREVHLRLMPVYRALFLEPNPGPLKGALNALGLPAGPVRGPLVDAAPETVQAVLDALDHAGLRR